MALSPDMPPSRYAELQWPIRIYLGRDLGETAQNFRPLPRNLFTA